MDTKTWCRDTVLAVTSHECGVSVLQGCNSVNKSSNQHVIVVVNIYTKRSFSKKNTHSFSVLSGQPTNQLSAQFPSHYRGQRSDKWGQLAQDQTALRGLSSKWNQKAFLTAVSYRHTEPLPSLASPHNWQANFETDAWALSWRIDVIFIHLDNERIKYHFGLSFSPFPRLLRLVELLGSS